MTHLMQVDQPGMFSLVQDLGRYGWQRFGVPANGAMDERAHRIANALVGNDDDAATLECTLTGPTLRFTRNTLIALSGADMAVTADGKRVPLNRAVMLRRGAVLAFSECRQGTRTYLAVRGGIDTELVMGSRSTFVRGAYGGVEGRALKRGDRVPLVTPQEDPLPLERMLVQSGLPFVEAGVVELPASASEPAPLRFMRGPQWRKFSMAARRAFTREAFVISTQSDRMGYRLDGPELDLKQPLEMISEACEFGTVQVPPSGSPIVLMADRQSAGGYPKIAYVISTDLPLLAQARPGDSLHFTPVTLRQAELAHAQAEQAFARFRQQAADAALSRPLTPAPAATQAVDDASFAALPE
ncbi:biotin-dependent carboxyltransferase family protein [Pigmentiphaga aceris]|uniref:Biotin-dependent carboxyltransferase family protein n=1 Tax=Pigmentiphaga aceris TaxID=1940612 RepID=A0A5C0B6B1_9BURK|nr:biotin-dependent carboxyltransferase family protein [Pigmentiphaga aceris]QEI08157.1 biotin-dependent carboxyltransferase family protein [Pigmentiphaga aceris]